MQTRRWLNPDVIAALLLATMVPWLIFATTNIYSLRQEIAVIKSQLTILVKGFAVDEKVIDDHS